MNWELRTCFDVPCTLDDSGVYTIINRIVPERRVGDTADVRLDLMKSLENEHHEAIVSFQGTANNVRKALAHYVIHELDVSTPISAEHWTYIGYELLRAETDPNYVQD